MEDQKEKRIPVFTVWKNNAILKNIFLINSPPSPNQFQNDEMSECQQEFEETLVVGRHPDCDIRVEHPSISRFHLRIHSRPSSKHLFLTDLSSVHGTWVSGKRIDPDVKTRLNENDTLRIGGSSRVYQLHWIPLSQAYDVSNPFVPPLDFVEPQEDEEEVIIEEESSLGQKNEEVQSADSDSKGLELGVLCDDVSVIEQVASKTEEVVGVENECVGLEDPDMEGLMSLFLDEKPEEFVQEEMPHDPSELNVNENLHSMDSALEGLVPLFLGENWEWVGSEEDGNYMACLTGEEYTQSVKHEYVGSLDSVPGLDSLVLDENFELHGQKVIPSEFPMPEYMAYPMTPTLNSTPAEEISASITELTQNEYMGSLDSATKGLDSLILDENFEPCVQKVIPSELPMPEDMAYPMTSDLNTTAGERRVSATELTQNEVMGSLDSVSKGLDSWILDENFELCAQKIIPSEIPMPEDTAYPLTPELSTTAGERRVSATELTQNEDMGSLDSASKGLDSLILDENFELCVQKIFPSELPMPEDIAYPMTPKFSTTAGERSVSVTDLTENLNKIPLDEENTRKVIQSAPSSKPEDTASHKTTVGERGSDFVSKVIKSEHEIALQEANVQDDAWSFWCGSPVVPTSSLLTKGGLCTEDSDLDIENQYPENESEPKVLSERNCLDCVNVHENLSVKDHNGNKLWSFWSGNMGVESSVCSSLSDAGFFSESEKKSVGSCCQSPPLSSIKRPFESPLISSDQKSAKSNWSRRGKLQTTSQISISQSRENKMRSDQKKVEHEPLSRALFHVQDDREEDEIFTPGKENYTPETNRSLRKLAMLQEAKNSGSAKSPLLNAIGNPKLYYGDCMSPSSDKENKSPRTILKQKTAQRSSVKQVKSVRQVKGERMPFETLFSDSPQKSTTETCLSDAAKTSISHQTHLPDNCSGATIQKWSMLVDTTSLLNEESRKALQLLEGLKGTELIIPKIVIKDLACLKRQTSFFRRNTEVSSALKWIEDCMLKTEWWIHVQNSMEEGWPVAPTPPASPYSQMSLGATTAGSFAFSALQFQPELLSPTVEDHVLDYALSFKRNKNDGQLVLISNDVTLKIKAMAEGIICETAEEFRESLVNPFSERFLWADSSPIGQTWSYLDDIVLKEKFYPSSLKMTPRAMEQVKGLKLILLHNSQYFERRTAIH